MSRDATLVKVRSRKPGTNRTQVCPIAEPIGSPVRCCSVLSTSLTSRYVFRLTACIPTGSGTLSPSMSRSNTMLIATSSSTTSRRPLRKALSVREVGERARETGRDVSGKRKLLAGTLAVLGDQPARHVTSTSVTRWMVFFSLPTVAEAATIFRFVPNDSNLCPAWHWHQPPSLCRMLTAGRAIRLGRAARRSRSRLGLAGLARDHLDRAAYRRAGEPA